MLIRIGCRLEISTSQPTPMIAMLTVHKSRRSDLIVADRLIACPVTEMSRYADSYGNGCTRMLAPAGTFALTTDGIFYDCGTADPVMPTARQFDVVDLPSDTLIYLLGSRYCDTDILSETAWRLFGGGAADWSRVQDICDYIGRNLTFDYQRASSTRSASQALAEGKGVCRDFAHLAITFCRCMNIPARYCTGYLSDIGEAEPFPPADFAAWMEVYLDSRWWVFDPRNNAPRKGRILVARGRDASDVPLTQTFGTHLLTEFEVWTHEVQERDVSLLQDQVQDREGTSQPFDLS
jgi:transglutaminase-like putative cysteine protease